MCDRVAIKEGSIVFVEFKPKGQKLRAAQKEVSDIAGSGYLTVFYSLDEFRGKTADEVNALYPAWHLML